MLDCWPATSIPILLLLPPLSLSSIRAPPAPYSSLLVLLRFFPATLTLLAHDDATQTMSRHSVIYLLLPSHPKPIGGFRHPLQAMQVSSITGYSEYIPPPLLK